MLHDCYPLERRVLALRLRLLFLFRHEPSLVRVESRRVFRRPRFMKVFYICEQNNDIWPVQNSVSSIRIVIHSLTF